MMANNGFQGSYANERPPSSTGSGEGIADIASDPASSSFFMNDFKKHEDLKSMLDGNKDNVKLEAMKRIIGMVAKGKDVSDLFPAVVKNVVSKNAEVKKLVFVYLVRYAEEQQDLALLSISTFQRALKDPNQLIRASALRVLSSIRVPVIVPIMMLAIKESVMDMSPYVRKTAAHAIPKLYSLDPEQKEILVEVIEKLLGDKTTLVAGSAIQAFEEVCPERIDLIHKNYRKLCTLLVDVEEWGQVIIINMMTRYARTQFVNPNLDDTVEENNEKAFYASSEDSEKEEEEEDEEKPKKKPYMMDPDHRLLLRTCKPLLNSRNAAVVMAVAQLYHHCAPRSEVNLIAKALVRLLRSFKEVQYVVLSNIAAASIKRKGMFEPFLKSFYVRSNDPLPVKLLKLEILTNLATETNISTILREFQTYVTSSDKDFAAATIQAIGRCASSIEEITDACLNGLVSLMSNRDESVVAESVVVIKKLLQMQPTEHKDIIIHMAKLADGITVPMARASILWLIGEYSDRVPKIAPDVLRKMAKNFINEENIVKLQILNLAAKLIITNSKQTKLLSQYVFNLAKYDQNYDIRDRARFLRQLIMPAEKTGSLVKHVKKIFLSTKPAPVLQSKFKDRDQYQLGTLSHLMDTKASGYQELPEWPEDAPDPTVRNVEVVTPWLDIKPDKKSVKKKKTSFYSDTESSVDDSSATDDSSEEEGSSEEESGSESASKDGTEKSGSEASKSESEEESEDETEDETSEEESSEEEESENDSEEEKKPPPKVQKKKTKESGGKGGAAKSGNDLLLDLDDLGLSAAASPVMTPGDVLTPTMASDLSSHSLSDKVKTPSQAVSGAVFIPSKKYELVNRMTGGGLSAEYRFTRSMSVFSPKMVSVEVTFTNQCDKPVVPIKVGNSKLQSGMELHSFPEINHLDHGASTSVTMGIDFNDTTQPANFEICTAERKFNVTVKAPVGELLQPISMSENEFNQHQSKLTGMNENSSNVELPPGNQDAGTISNRVYEAANVIQVPGMNENECKFSAKTMGTGSMVLVKVTGSGNKASVVVNCEKMVIGSMLLKDIKSCLSR